MALRITTPPSSTPQALDPVATASRLGAVGEEVAAVATLIEQKTEDFENLTGLKLWYRAYHAMVEGDDDDRLYLLARPIVEVTSVKQGDDDALTEGSESDNFDPWHDDGYLFREDCWPSGRPRWTVDFTAGWWLPSMPPSDFAASGAKKLKDDRPDVALAIQDMVDIQWQLDQRDRTVKKGSVQGFSMVEYAVDAFMTKTAHRTLRQLRPLHV